MKLFTKHTVWFFNVLTYNLFRLNPFRNKRVWVFGAWMGNKYDDNTRFFFEYVNEYYKDKINAVWLTKDRKVVNQVRELGYQAFSYKSFRGCLYELRAGVAIYTHGLDDFGLFPMVGGAEIVSLWHGMALKKIYNEKYDGMKLRIKKAMDVFFTWTYRDITIVTSEFAKEQFIRTFNLKDSSKFCFSGQPRNDVLWGLDKSIVLKNVPVDITKRIIVYMPTYRMACLGKDAMKNIVQQLYSDSYLDKVLKDTNSVFIVKLHPVTPDVELSNRENFVILRQHDVESNQKLLGVADMLVTDYSSCCIDYALLERPVVFYLPDEKDFLENSEPLYDVFFEISRLNRCITVEDLALKISRPSMAAVYALNQTYNNKETRDANSCRRVFEFLSKEIRLDQ